MRLDALTRDAGAVLALDRTTHPWLWDALALTAPDTIRLERIAAPTDADGVLTFGPPEGSTTELWESPATTVALVPRASEPDELDHLLLSRPAGSLTLVGVTFGDLFEQVELRVRSGGDGAPFAIPYWRFAATLPYGNGRSAAVQLAPRGEHQLLLDAELGREPPSLGDLIGLLGDHDDLAWLPDELRSGAVVAVERLAGTFEREDGGGVELIRVAADLAFGDDRSWPLVPGVDGLEVGELGAHLAVDHPLEPDVRYPTLGVTGTLRVGPADAPARIDLVARWPDYAVTGELRAGDAIEVGALLEHLGLPAAGLPDEEPLEVTGLGFRAEPVHEPRAFSFHGEIANAWKVELGAGALEIVDLSLTVRYREDRNPALTGGFLGRVTVAERPLFVSVEREGDGWRFAGGTSASGEDAEALPLGAWIADLAAVVGPGLAVPPAVADFTVTRVELELTSGGDFALAFDCHAPVGDGLDASVRYDSADGVFRGSVSVDELVFDLLLERGGDEEASATTLVAVYRDPRGHRQNIRALAARLSPDLARAVPAGLEFTLRDALLARRSAVAEGDPGQSRHLLAADVAGGLDLSELKLPDLPLVGGGPPPGESLRLEFRLLAASHPFAADPDVAAVRALAGEGVTLPNRDVEGVDLAPTLHLGRETRRLSLPVALDPAGEGTGVTGVAPAEEADVAHDAADAVGSDGTRWFTVQKSFGPVHVERLGLNYAGGRIAGLLDASLGVGGLTLSLDGLTVASPLTAFAPEVSLDGLGLAYDAGEVAIGGAFLKRRVVPPGGEPYTAFSGLATLRTETLALSAIGSYAEFGGHPSMFVYAVLDYPLGGPAFFFVTGLAAGFGYNRALKLPAIERVRSFPLVAEAVAGAAPPLGGADADGADLDATLSDRLARLEPFVRPATGEHFLAAGLKFTSFELIDSFALLSVRFGEHLEVGLLGLSTLQSPPAEAGAAVPPVARAELAIRASFVPDEGFLGVRGQLTRASFILSRDCHLSGGFAFYSWFSGEHAGDFVATMGGYHPDFHRPGHYPRVPRLELNWQVTDELSVKGREYYALTAHALMAGGSLEAVYETDDLRAWFDASADFLIAWKPYHYDARMHVAIGAEATIHFLGTHHVSFEASADLRLWGPPFAGEAHVEVKVIGITFSFDVSFGGGPALPAAIGWEEFAASFLPPPAQVCTLSIASGLIRTLDAGGRERWIVDPKELTLLVQSAVPLAEPDRNAPGAGPAPGIRPMGVRSFGSDLQLRDGAGRDLAETFRLEPVRKAVPAALWGEPRVFELPGTQQRFLAQPPLNDATLLPGVLAGYRLTPLAAPTAGHTHPVDPAALRYDTHTVADAFAWQDAPAEDPGAADRRGRAAFEAARAGMGRHPARRELLRALGLADAEIDLDRPVDEGALLPPVPVPTF